MQPRDYFFLVDFDNEISLKNPTLVNWKSLEMIANELIESQVLMLEG